MYEQDFSTYSFIPHTETETGQYFSLRPSSISKPERSLESFIAKAYFAPPANVQEIAFSWKYINQCVADSVEVVHTMMRDEQRVLVFKNRPQRMCDVLSQCEELDLTVQIMRCAFVARSVLELHRAMYIHTRLHPKRFYLESDGKFKLGHFSQVKVINSSSEVAGLMADERVRLGKLMMYLMTNIPFDKLLEFSPIEAANELLPFQFPKEIQRIKQLITALLVPRDGRGSEDDIEEVLHLCKHSIPKSLVPERLHMPQIEVQTIPGTIECSCCGPSGGLKSANRCATLPCSHRYCYMCVHNALLSLSSGTFVCAVCDFSVKAIEILQTIPDQQLSKVLIKRLISKG